jgi:hypothetical protein
MALTDIERAAVQLQLDEARLALHRLEIGQGEVSLAYNGETVTYAAADLASLRLYIRGLEAKLGLRLYARARARGVVFG